MILSWIKQILCLSFLSMILITEVLLVFQLGFLKRKLGFILNLLSIIVLGGKRRSLVSLSCALIQYKKEKVSWKRRLQLQAYLRGQIFSHITWDKISVIFLLFCCYANLSHQLQPEVSFHNQLDVLNLPPLCWHCSKTLRLYPVDSPCE